MTFQKATKKEAKLRMAIDGPAGAGKTFTALTLAAEIANGGSIAVIDTERGSASKYADLFDFDVLELGKDPKDLHPFHPDRYIDAIKAASAAGYSVLIIDSMTHAWNDKGGILDLLEEEMKRRKTTNSYICWSALTPIQNRFISAIMGAPLHIIATMRSKQDYSLGNENGKTTVKKVGMAPVQREGVDYEFDIVVDMDVEHNGIISKTRCYKLSNAVIPKPGKDLAETIIQWLHGEKVEDPVPTPQPAKVAVPVKTSNNGKLNINEIYKRCVAVGYSTDELKEILKGVLGLDSLKDCNETHLGILDIRLKKIETGESDKSELLQAARENNNLGAVA